MDIDATKLIPTVRNSVEACIHWMNISENTAYTDEALTLLDRTEQNRAKDLRQKHMRTAFILTRAALRSILAIQLNRPPETIKFSYGTHGKPKIEKDCQAKHGPLHFNVSHSQDYAVIAVCRNRRVGVDIEYRRPDRSSHMRIARRYFSEREVTALESMEPAMRLRSFYNCWARKEAYAKAVGLGIQVGLDSFDTGRDFISPADILPPLSHQFETLQWSVHNLEIDSNYAAAIAIECETKAAKLSLKQFTHNSIR